jgi:uncharacterized protein (TIGR00730 family)
MNNLANIAVFCGSSPGLDQRYAERAQALGTAIVNNGMKLVYGGGNIGLMGVIANTVLDLGSSVTGVLPHFLNRKEVGHVALSKLILVDSMHERKQRMSELADAFIAMPGGFGTLEEITEMLTWSQLGLSRKPLGFYNVNGFFDPLIAQFDKMVEEGFLKPQNRHLAIVEPDPGVLLQKLREFEPIAVPKWLHSDQT